MLAIGRDDVVLVVERVNRADGDGLLAGIEMAEAGDFAAAVHLGGLLLEAPDERHAPIEVEELALVKGQQRVLRGMLVAFERHGLIVVKPAMGVTLPWAGVILHPVWTDGKPEKPKPARGFGQRRKSKQQALRGCCYRPERAAMDRRRAELDQRSACARWCSSPCVARSRSRDTARRDASIMRSRVTLAMIDAAAMQKLLRSPPTIFVCGSSRPGNQAAVDQHVAGREISTPTARGGSPTSLPNRC